MSHPGDHSWLRWLRWTNCSVRNWQLITKVALFCDILDSVAISYNNHLAKAKADVSVPMDTSATESSLNESKCEQMVEVFSHQGFTYIFSHSQVLREVLQTQLNSAKIPLPPFPVWAQNRNSDVTRESALNHKRWRTSFRNYSQQQGSLYEKKRCPSQN